MILLKIEADDGDVIEMLASSVEVSDDTGDDSLRLRVMEDARTIKLDSAPL